MVFYARFCIESMKLVKCQLSHAVHFIDISVCLCAMILMFSSNKSVLAYRNKKYHFTICLLHFFSLQFCSSTHSQLGSFLLKHKHHGSKITYKYEKLHCQKPHTKKGAHLYQESMRGHKICCWWLKKKFGNIRKKKRRRRKKLLNEMCFDAHVNLCSVSSVSSSTQREMKSW